ncbi:MAG: class II glutamine amidotransferase [Pseudomonadota bacterium]
MCELFGLSASQPVPADATPLAAFRERGGRAADNPDGWGLAWRVPGEPAEAAFLIAKEPEPGADSGRFARLAATLSGDLLIGHVRKARLPPINTLDNTHPFQHACCGRQWIFAHNGLLPDMAALARLNQAQHCRPEGATDSEAAFCHLLDRLRLRVVDGWLDELARVSEAIALLGKFNFLLSDGEHLIAYGHDRLHHLEQSLSTYTQALVATEPLTEDPGWKAFQPGELRIYRAGVPVAWVTTHPPAARTELQEP